MQVDITNYAQVLPKIVEEIKNCNFIALDIEFTGLFCNINCMPSLFDSLEERYNKLRTNTSNFIPCQLGLSLFTKHDTKNEYKAQTYSFFCCPRFYGPLVNCFSMETSAIEFLVENSFDFNRFARFGIPYLNKSQEQLFRKFMADKSMIDVNHSMMDKLADLRRQISDWASELPVRSGRRCGEHIFPYEPSVNPLVNFLIVYHLRNELKNFWINQNGNDLIVKTVTPAERVKLLTTLADETEQVINSCIGLSKIVQQVINSSKPIIGNNMMVDLVMLYHHFIEPLPDSLEKFKKEVLKRFSSIYDVKSIISNIKKHFPAYEDDLSASNLGSLYQKLSSKSFVRDSPHQPVLIRDDDLGCDIVNRCHDAGSDAYATGYVFLRVCAMIATINAEESNEPLGEPTDPLQSSTPQASPKWESLIEPLLCLKNKINLIRAAFHYMDLEAESQKPVKPEWLVLRCRDPSKTITMSQVHQMFSVYGTTIDFKQISKSEVMLAIGNFRSAREVIERFRKDKQYKITKYSMIRDTKVGRFFLWTTFIVGTGTTGYLAYKVIRGKYF